jgi:TolB-like protein
VLPFENLGRSDDAYFADGVTEEISGRIGSLSGLRLVGRQSARSYAGTTKSLSQIGKELGVTYVLTGSVRWDRSLPGHDRVRVIPALVRVTDGTQIWSNVSEDELRGIFGLQSKVAEEVAQALKIHLSTAERQVLEARPTQNVEAYDYYLRGMSAMLGLRGSDMMKAVTLLKRATELDPKFALAYVALGVAHTNVFWFVADLRPERLQMAKQAIDRALALDPNLPAAHNALGNYYYHGLLDFERALREFNAVHRLSPNDAEALASKSRIERRQGKWDESIESDRQAILLDPRNINYIYDQGYNLVLTRRYDAADSIARQLIEIDPSRWLGYRLRIHVALLKSGDVKTALGIFREAKDRTDPETFGSDILLFPWPVYLDSSLLEAVRSVRPPSSLLERLVYFQGLGMIALYQGDPVAARAMGDSIVKLAHTGMRGSILDQDLGEVLAAGHAFRGERAEALTEARKGPRLFPKSRDAIRVADYLIQLGYVATIVGADDEAISAFENTLAMPAFTSSTLLRTDPLLARLRANSRFGRLLVNR